MLAHFPVRSFVCVYMFVSWKPYSSGAPRLVRLVWPWLLSSFTNVTASARVFQSLSHCGDDGLFIVLRRLRTGLGEACCAAKSFIVQFLGRLLVPGFLRG